LLVSPVSLVADKLICLIEVGLLSVAVGVDSCLPDRVTIPADQLDVPMANEFLRERKTMLGTGGIMVMDDTTCMVRASCVITFFFRDESCGQCTQCREGTGWLHKLVTRLERGAGSTEDIEILSDVTSKMDGHTICAFADAAAWPVQGMLRHFREDFDLHVTHKKCPFPQSFEL